MDKVKSLSELVSVYETFKSLFYQIRETEYGIIFAWLWPGDTRKNPQHEWYKSALCLELINSMIEKLNSLAEEPIKVIDNGEEIYLERSVLGENLVYYCDDCKACHINPTYKLQDILRFEIKKAVTEHHQPPSAIQLVTEKYRKQIGKEYIEGDNSKGELAQAASCYAMPKGLRILNDSGKLAGIPYQWPDSWYLQWWKPSPEDRIAELVTAGALILAEIDRLLGNNTKRLMNNASVGG